MKALPSDAPADVIPIEELGKTVELSRHFNFSGLGTLFRLTVRQHTRGGRLLILAVLYSLAIVAAIIARLVERPPPLPILELILVFTWLPNAIVPLTALLYSSGMIQDEVEEQTLTYLLIRPLPRWAIYLTKLAATMLITIVMAAFFTILTYLALYLFSPDFSASFLAGRVARAVLLISLALFTYCAVFGYISLLTKRSLVVGVAYIILLEGWLATIDLVVRRFTVMYYFRTASVSWLNLSVPGWNLGDPPSAGACVLILLVAGFIIAGLSAVLFASREFRLKTPEGS